MTPNWNRPNEPWRISGDKFNSMPKYLRAYSKGLDYQFSNRKKPKTYQWIKLPLWITYLFGWPNSTNRVTKERVKALHVLISSCTNDEWITIIVQFMCGEIEL